MRKLLRSLKFFGQAFLLVALLLGGWLYINISNLFKDKKQNNDGHARDGVWGPADVHADAPSGGGGVGGCPHVAVFDGNAYCIENDFLLGKPKSFLISEPMIRALYEAGRIGQDMLVFSKKLGRKNGNIALQIQEIEREETFIDWLRLVRVTHSPSAVVVPEADFTSYRVLKRTAIEAAKMPVSVVAKSGADLRERFKTVADLWKTGYPAKADAFEPGEAIKFSFEHISERDPLLLIQSCFRDWMMPNDPYEAANRTFWNAVTRPVFQRGAFAAAAFLYLVFGGKSSASLLAGLPLLMGVQGKSIRFSYEAKNGSKKRILIHEPRDWRYTNEIIPIPRDAVHADGTVTIWAEFTKCHALRFAGIIEGAETVPSHAEEIPLIKATHSRLGDVHENFVSGNETYAHLLPGDTIDLEFSDNASESDEVQATYLMSSGGFYTALRSHSNFDMQAFEQKLSPEAKAHYQRLSHVG